MKRDIVPYTEDTARLLGDALARLDVPSFGPATGMALLRVSDGLNKLLQDQRLDNDQRAVLVGYQSRLLDVAAVAAYHQKGVIDKLAAIMNRTTGGQS